MTPETLHDALGLLSGDLITAVDKLRSKAPKKQVHWMRYASIAACLALILYGGFLVMTEFLPKAGNTSSADQAAAEAVRDLSPAEEEIQLDGIAQSPAATQAAAGEVQNGAASGSSEKAEEPAISDSSQEPLAPTGYPASGSYFANLSATQYCMTNLYPDSTLNISSEPETVLIQSREELETYYQEYLDIFELGTFWESCAMYIDTWFEDHDLLMIRLGTSKSEYVPEVQSLTLTSETACEIAVTLAEMPEDNTLDPAYWHILMEVKKNVLQEEDTVTVNLA